MLRPSSMISDVVESQVKDLFGKVGFQNVHLFSDFTFDVVKSEGKLFPYGIWDKSLLNKSSPTPFAPDRLRRRYTVAICIRLVVGRWLRLAYHDGR